MQNDPGRIVQDGTMHVNRLVEAIDAKGFSYKIARVALSARCDDNGDIWFGGAHGTNRVRGGRMQCVLLGQ